MRVGSLALCACLVLPTPAGAQTRQNPVRPGEFGPFVRLIKNVQPLFPLEARRKGVRGMVILDLVVTPTGRVDSVKVLRPLDLVTGAAVAAARQWQYMPPTVQGKRAWMAITVSVAFPPEPEIMRRRSPSNRRPEPSL